MNLVGDLTVVNDNAVGYVASYGDFVGLGFAESEIDVDADHSVA